MDRHLNHRLIWCNKLLSCCNHSKAASWSGNLVVACICTAKAARLKRHRSPAHSLICSTCPVCIIMASRQVYPPVQYTVEELTADRSQLDITEHVRRDPKYQVSVGSGAGGDVYRATYDVIDSKTQRPFSLNVVVKILRGTPDQKKKIEEACVAPLCQIRSILILPSTAAQSRDCVLAPPGPPPCC